MTQTYSVEKLIGNIFKAKTSVPVYRSVYAKKAFYTVPAGGNIGTLYSWIEKNGVIWFMFYDSKKKPYYVKHIEGSGQIDASSFKTQGVKTVEEATKEQQQKEKESNMGQFELFISKYAKPGFLIVAGLVAFGIILKRK